MVNSHGVHPVYVRVLCDLLAKRKLDLSGILATAGLTSANLGDTAGPGVTMSQVFVLLRLARQACADPLLPIQWGRRIRSPMHGIFGTAVFSSRDVRHALETACELAPLQSTAFDMTLSESGDSAQLRCEPNIPLGELHSFMNTAKALMTINVLRTLMGRHIAEVCVEFPFASPVWAADRGQHCPTQARFGADCLNFRFPRALLDQPLLSADARVHDAAMLECRQELPGSTLSLAARVQAYIARQSQSQAYPSLDDTAAHFRLSPRSFRRALHSDGHNFQALTDAVRMESAQRLLEDTGLSVQQISERVGYSDASNFVRAFRRLRGQTPHQWRRGTA